MSGTAMIVDGQNLLMRAIFASKGSMMSSGGVPTGPLVIFVNSLAKHVQQERPARLVVCWDGGTSAERVERLPSYKAQRKAVPEEEAQFRDGASDLVRRFLALSGVFQVHVRGMEADDLIAGAWHNLELADRIVVLSSDKDFMQLLGPNPQGIETEQIRLSSAGTKTDRWHYTRFVEEFGYDPRNWPLMTSLTGDTGDGVPGLPGIGPVKARKLWEAAAWSMEHLAVDPEQREVVEACFDVVNLRQISFPTPVPLWRPTRQDSLAWRELIEFLSAYQLISIKDRLQAGELWSVRDLITATEGDHDRNGRL